MDNNVDTLEAELTRVGYQLPARFQQRLRGIPPPQFNAEVFGYGRWYASFGDFCFNELGVTVNVGVLEELSALLCSRHAIKLMLDTAGLGDLGAARWYMAFDVSAEESDALMAEIMKPLLGYALRDIYRRNPNWAPTAESSTAPLESGSDVGQQSGR